MRIALFALLFLLAPPVFAGEIYRWVDPDGRVHFSNRGPAASPEPPSGGEGWESVLERQEGTDEFSRRADAVINDLNVDRIRRKRERDRAYDALLATQREIVRLQKISPPEAYALRPREAEQVNEVRRLDVELAQLEARIEKAKAIKAMGREQAEKLGQNPFFEFGQ